MDDCLMDEMRVILYSADKPNLKAWNKQRESIIRFSPQSTERKKKTR